MKAVGYKKSLLYLGFIRVIHSLLLFHRSLQLLMAAAASAKCCRDSHKIDYGIYSCIWIYLRDKGR